MVVTLFYCSCDRICELMYFELDNGRMVYEADLTITFFI